LTYNPITYVVLLLYGHLLGACSKPLLSVYLFLSVCPMSVTCHN